ncbi:DNA repair protein RadA [Angustibacter speluncae]
MSAAKTARTARPSYRCAECGWAASKWVGRCGECQAWGTVEEVGAVTVRTTQAAPVRTPARPIDQVDVETARAVPTRVDELDRVLGGGLVPGAVVLVAGEPGVGKSTLLLDVAGQAAASGRTVLYVTGEESASQVRLRAERIGAIRPRLYLASETDLATVLGHVEQVEPDLLVVDSVQTISSGQVEGQAGNVSQVREVAAALIRVAKARNLPTLLVGHVTKDGSIAGPRTLEHLVDVVCQFEGERHSRLRLVRAVKNRYGPTDEVGCFDLSEDGIVGLTDPSGLFLSRTDVHAPGSCVTVTLEGRRPLVAEVQALVTPTEAKNPRRATSGLDGARVSMVQAVISARMRVALFGQDVFVSTVGGVRIGEPAADLAITLAMASAAVERPLPPRMVAFGEVGLSGEVRPVPGLGRRLSEAARLGFTTAVVPRGGTASVVVPDGMKVVEIGQVVEALRLGIVRPVGDR